MQKSLQQQLTQKTQNVILASTGAQFLMLEGVQKAHENSCQNVVYVHFNFEPYKNSEKAST